MEETKDLAAWFGVNGEHWQKRELFCRIRKSTGTQWDPHVAKASSPESAVFRAFSSSLAASLQVHRSFKFRIHVALKVFFFSVTIAEGYPQAAHRIHE